VPGNHPRATQKPQAKQAHNNADWLFYQFLAALLKGHPQFEFDIPRGSYNVQMIAERWRMLLMHGDGIRTTMPGVPWGGVIRRITVLESQFTRHVSRSTTSRSGTSTRRTRSTAWRPRRS
jgi:hypothetical protein